MGSASTLRLSFGDRMHKFDAAQQDLGAAKSLEPQHGARASLDRPMILLEELLRYFDWRIFYAPDDYDRRWLH
jgi:hypothetical protein